MESGNLSKATDSYWEDLLVVGGWFVQQITVDEHDALLHTHGEVLVLRRDGRKAIKLWQMLTRDLESADGSPHCRGTGSGRFLNEI